MSEMYKKSGVNLDEAEKLNRKLSKSLQNKNVGLFAGSSYIEDLGVNILNCCDGIGSKIIPLYEKKMYKTIAIDLVAANLNDLATQNAKAVLFSDYIAVNKLDSDAISSIIIELQNELKKCDCELSGGETSEIPHLLKEGTIDICGFAIGISKEMKQSQICKDDIVIALKSSGIHANGFSLIRKLHEEHKLTDEEFNDCLAPSYVYYNVIKSLWRNGLIKSGANITGGGILSNLERIVPEGLNLDLNFDLIPKQPIYSVLQNIVGDEIWNVFNCGVGFCVVADNSCKDQIMKIAEEFNPFVLGKVVKND